MRRHATGVALPVALILLAALALLGVAGLGSAVAAYAIAAHDLHRAQAFEAAELAARSALAQGAGLAPGTARVNVESGRVDGVTGTASVTADDASLPPAAPEGFSVGEGGAGIRAIHFTITATGRAPLGAIAVVEQGFVVIAPTS